MSLYDALMIGVSGLNAQSRAMSIFSSNIANVNTVGYKGSASAFQTMLGAANGGAAGLSDGVMASAQANITQQGAEFATSSPTDLAITGNGFFCVSTSADKAAQMLYTRAGSFTPDSSGNLRNSAGLYLQGWPVNADGSVPNSGPLGPININSIPGKGEATSNLSLAANLDASADADPNYVVGSMTNGVPPVQPTYSTTVNVYDSQGGSQPLKISYIKTGANTWSYEVAYTGDKNNLDSTADPNAPLIATGNLTFNADGSLASAADTTSGSSVSSPDGSINISIPWNPATSGLKPQTIDFKMGTYGKTDGVTQFNSESVLNNTTVDGALFGNVTGTTIGADGTVYANFSNGLTQAEYKIPLATFANPDGLAQVGGNAFAVTQNSGAANLGTPGAGNRGGLQAYALEGSTVDLATEFTNMITTQQAYSASARVVSTASQMLDELMQIQH
jgi:flagellar hook protein FlgE